MQFRWNEWNVEHLARYGVEPSEAEEVVLAAKRPFPLRRDDHRWIVWGRARGGRLLQVVFVEDDEFVYVIHARGLTDREKRSFRKGGKP
jgi:uncharacterized DUF497 family protein